MTKLQYRYFEDPLLLEFDAKVIDLVALPDGRMGAILDQTYFYPTGGGQAHDTGFIGDARVIDVWRDESTARVVHVLEGNLSLGPVMARIDRQRRLSHMQHHTAQHLISACFEQLFGLETLSSNIHGDTPTTIDLPDVAIDEVMIAQVEALAHEIIFEDREVKTYFVNQTQAASVPFRRPPKVDGEVRVVEIANFDYSACGATHCPRTGMIGALKIVKVERQNQKARLHFVAGYQAVAYFHEIHTLTVALSEQMSTRPQDIFEAVQRQAEELKFTQRALKNLRLQQLGIEAQAMAGLGKHTPAGSIITGLFEGRDVDELQALAKEFLVMPEAIALLGTRNAGKLTLLIACGENVDVHAGDLLKQVLKPLGGRGGGSAQLAQGGGEISQSEFDNLFADTAALLE